MSKKKKNVLYSQRDIIIFFAGAEALHTVGHIVLWFSEKLPLSIFSITLTPHLNYWAIIINALITIGLLKWAVDLKK